MMESDLILQATDKKVEDDHKTTKEPLKQPDKNPVPTNSTPAFCNLKTLSWTLLFMLKIPRVLAFPMDARPSISHIHEPSVRTITEPGWPSGPGWPPLDGWPFAIIAPTVVILSLAATRMRNANTTVIFNGMLAIWCFVGLVVLEDPITSGW